MKKSILLITLILAVFCTACTTNNQESQTKQKSVESKANENLTVEKLIPNHYDFTKNILDDDFYIYNYDKNTYLVSSKGVKEIKEVIGDNVPIENQKLYGQKYTGFEGNESWKNPIIEYDIKSNDAVELLKDNKDFENIYLLSSRDNKLLLNNYKTKEERWDIGKGKTIEYDIKSKSSKEINFEFSKDYEKTSVICADFCGNGYIVSFAHVDSKKPVDEGDGTKVVLSDENGKTIKYLPTSNVSRNLKSSPDGSKIIYSEGSTGANVYILSSRNL